MNRTAFPSAMPGFYASELIDSKSLVLFRLSQAIPFARHLPRDTARHRATANNPYGAQLSRDRVGYLRECRGVAERFLGTFSTFLVTVEENGVARRFLGTFRGVLPKSGKFPSRDTTARRLRGRLRLLD